MERGNETILNIVPIACLEGKDWRKELKNFLFQYTVIGVSPAELLMGRILEANSPKTVQRNLLATALERETTVQSSSKRNMQTGHEELY